MFRFIGIGIVGVACFAIAILLIWVYLIAGDDKECVEGTSMLYLLLGIIGFLLGLIMMIESNSLFWFCILCSGIFHLYGAYHIGAHWETPYETVVWYIIERNDTEEENEND